MMKLFSCEKGRPQGDLFYVIFYTGIHPAECFTA